MEQGGDSMEYLPIVAIFGIGLIASVAMRKTSSRAVKILIGVPANDSHHDFIPEMDVNTLIRR